MGKICLCLDINQIIFGFDVLTYDARICWKKSRENEGSQKFNESLNFSRNYFAEKISGKIKGVNQLMIGGKSVNTFFITREFESSVATGVTKVETVRAE